MDSPLDQIERRVAAALEAIAAAQSPEELARIEKELKLAQRAQKVAEVQAERAALRDELEYLKKYGLEGRGGTLVGFIRKAGQPSFLVLRDGDRRGAYRMEPFEVGWILETMAKFDDLQVRIPDGTHLIKDDEILSVGGPTNPNRGYLYAEVGFAQFVGYVKQLLVEP